MRLKKHINAVRRKTKIPITSESTNTPEPVNKTYQTKSNPNCLKSSNKEIAFSEVEKVNQNCLTKRLIESSCNFDKKAVHSSFCGWSHVDMKALIGLASSSVTSNPVNKKKVSKLKQSRLIKPTGANNKHKKQNTTFKPQTDLAMYIEEYRESKLAKLRKKGIIPEINKTPNNLDMNSNVGDDYKYVHSEPK